MVKELFTAEEVAKRVQVSVQTLNIWYRYKRENPNSELAQILPEFQKKNSTAKRYWKKEDIKKVLEFKHRKNIGRYGQLASVTQKYVRKEN